MTNGQVGEIREIGDMGEVNRPPQEKKRRVTAPKAATQQQCLDIL